MANVVQHRDPTIVVRGAVSASLVAYALEKLEAATATTKAPLLAQEIRLDRHNDPARDRPFHVEYMVVVNGRPVRAHRSAETLTEAIDVASSRLRRQLEDADATEPARRLRHRDLTSWHHQDAPESRPAYFPRPVGAREVIRRKTFAIGQISIEEALFDLEVLDHDFFLFSSEENGEENVVYRDGTGYGIMQPTPTPSAVARVGTPIEVGPRPAEMQLVDACRVLDASDQPFVFYLDEGTGRGRVLYRRYDGHYGLIVPA